MKLLWAAIVVWAGCSDHDRAEVKRDPERQRRVVEPPSPGVRALPPHAIRGDGVGPYRLGDSLAELLDQLPAGPRIAQFNIPGIVHRDILRAEDDAILIGGEPQGRASFVAVVGGEVARTESGIHVGSTRSELSRALGVPLDEPDHARDPRIVVPSGLRNAHVVLEGDRVIALVVAADEGRTAPPKEPATEPCTRPASEPEVKKLGACLTAAGEVVAIEGDDLIVRSADGERVIAQTRVPGLAFAVPLRGPEGKDELIAITRVEEAQVRSWILAAYKLDGARLTRSIEPTPLYQLTTANARWIGAELRDLELYLELASRPDTIEVGGLLTTRIGDKIRDIVVISPVQVPRRHAKSAPPEAADAGATDAQEAGSQDKRSR